MTIQALKDLLATYGVNEEERNAPVMVTTMDGAILDVVAGEVDWEPHDGPSVLLTAVAR